MKLRASVYLHLAAAALLVVFAWPSHTHAQVQSNASKNVLIVVGPSTHPPGTHEVAAGARVVEHCLTHAKNVSGVQAQVVSKWPDDRQLLQKISTIVFTGDRFPPEEMPDRDRNMSDLATMMDHGCGLVFIH